MSRKNIPDAKNRILQAAIQVFAEKSFAGSRVDEVAQVANVPKSVIYYHFQSKEEILEVLIQNFLRDYLELIAVAENDTHQTKAQELAERMQSRYARFAENNADMIRIILVESLKKSADKPVIFKIVEAMIEKETAFPAISNWRKYDKQERLVAEFFTNIIPHYAYICFGESWVDHFGVEKERLGELFVNVFLATHGAYHQNHE